MSWEPLAMASSSAPHEAPHRQDWASTSRLPMDYNRREEGRRSDKLEAELEHSSEDDADLQKALETSRVEYEALKRERDVYQRALDQSASEAALAAETDRLDIDRATAQSQREEEERLARQREQEAEMDRVMQESARQAEAQNLEEQEMLEQALALSRQIASRDHERRRGWGTPSDSGEDQQPTATTSKLVNNPEEEPLRILGPSGISLLWKNGRSMAPTPRDPNAPLTRPAHRSNTRPLPQPPGLPGHAGSHSPRTPSTASATLPRTPSYVPVRSAPPVPHASPPRGQALHISRPPVPSDASRPLLSAKQSTSATFGEHPPTIHTLGRQPITLSSLANPRASPPLSTAPPSIAGDSIQVQDGHAQEVEDPFDDQFEYSPTIWSQGSYKEDGHAADDENSEQHFETPRQPAIRTFDPHLVYSSPTADRPLASSEQGPPPALAFQPARNAFIPREAPAIEYPTRRSETQTSLPGDAPRRLPHESRAADERPLSTGERREGRVAAGAVIPNPGGGSHRADIEDVSRWGFLGRRLVKGEGLPDVIQLSNAAGEGKYSIFLIETPTWRTLLRLLMWYGATRLEASPRDFVDRKSGAPFQCNIVLDFFATAVCLSLRLLPQTRGRSKLFSASRRCVVLPTSPIALPTNLSAIATQLHESLATSRSLHHGPLHGLQHDVDGLARAAGEPVAAALEAERGMLERLKARVLKQQKRRSTQLGEEAVGDDAVLIQPFRLDEYGG